MSEAESFVPKEIIGALGITRSQFTNRVRLLGIKQSGSYTFDEAYAIASYSPKRRQASEKRTADLKKRILDRMSEDGYTATFVKQKNGTTVLVKTQRR